VLRVLLVEDSPADADLTVHELRRAGLEFTFERVQDAEGLRAALNGQPWDVVLSDEAMPNFDAAQALDVLQGSGKDIPLIVVSGTIGEEAAVRLMKAGAQDFILKDRIARLGPAVQRELREALGRRRQRQDAMARVEFQQQLEQANRRMSVLSARLLEAQEGERALLARDLHDDLGQLLTALQLQLEALRRRAAAARDQTQLDDCLALVGQVLTQVRTLSLDLRPPQLDNLGLAAALRWFAERKLSPMAGVTLKFSADGLPALEAPVESTCFRIAQEALTNVMRHSGARHVEIDLKVVDGRLRMSICDDGSGFDVSEQYERSIRGESAGLLNMQERASLIGGRLELRSAPGNTRVMLDLPLETELSA